MQLIKEHLYDHITDDPPDPITKYWIKKDQKARALINLWIEDAQTIYVKHVSTTGTTWLALK